VSAPAAPAAKGELTHVKPSRLQQLIARRMAQSRASVPDFTLRVRVDMDPAADLRAQLKAAAVPGEPVPSLNDMVVKASALALREHPYANGSWVDDAFVLHGRVNVGVAVAAPGALVVPTVFDADRRSLVEIAAATRELAGRVRDGTVTPADMSGGTFTVSNLGMFGIEDFDAVVNAPQAAILAVGRMSEEPVVREGELVVGRVARLTLSCDHRILYGADAAQVLARIRELMESPASLLAASARPDESSAVTEVERDENDTRESGRG
jgi:pyruvate dehydrogenase E2 component (dihydrolipoamide acetyltransferase)